jgi:SNF family Na+-dependent transporter
MRLSTRHRTWVYGTFGLLFFSGTAWWILHRWFQTTGEFGQQPHAWQPGLLMIHGAAAMLALVVFGTLIPLHMKRGWKAGLNRPNGVMLVALVILLTLTGYALYYAGGEQSRATASFVHTALGLGFPAALVWHIAGGRRARRHKTGSDR